MYEIKCDITLGSTETNQSGLFLCDIYAPGHGNSLLPTGFLPILLKVYLDSNN